MSLQGIRNSLRLAAAVPVAASIVPISSGLLFPIAANQIVKGRIFLTFSVGAAGGCRFVFVVPAGGASFNASFRLFNNVAPAIVPAVQTAAADFTNALANAGNHNLEVDFDIVNGATAGNIDFQFAQNTSDATAITLFIGCGAEIVYL
jgi:hypothetical protein